jgi:1-acyl-sn-glycerol-3-phosphate acyltransferase
MTLTGSEVLHLARRWRAVSREPLADDPLARRDAAFIAEETGLLGAVCDTFYAPEILGMDHLPPGRALVVGTHNGGPLAPDMFSLMVGFWRHFGAARAAYGLAHDMVFKLPFLGKWIAKLGAVPASQENARLLLEKDVAVLVYPGGDVDAYKPYRERHVVKFGGRKGWVRLALRTGAPIVPVVSVGAHDIIYVLNDGAALAERLGIKRRFRIEVLPVVLALPFGVALGPFAPYLPLPTRVRVRVLPPVVLPHGPEAADDPATVDAIDIEVRASMQAALDALVAEGGFGPRERLNGKKLS